MANINCKIKRGMKGSANGRSRWDDTEILKVQSKKPRRREGKLEIEEYYKSMDKFEEEQQTENK